MGARESRLHAAGLAAGREGRRAVPGPAGAEAGCGVEGRRTLRARKKLPPALASAPCKDLPLRSAWGWGRSPRKQTACEGGCQSKALLLREPPGKSLVWRWSHPTFAAAGVGGEGARAVSRSALPSPLEGSDPVASNSAPAGLLVSKTGPCG